MKKFLPALSAALLLVACGSSEPTDEDVKKETTTEVAKDCLLYTSDAADD